MTARLRSGARKILSRESYGEVAANVRSHLPKLDKMSLLFFISMTIIVVIAVVVRILPLRWSFTLSEFDSYFHFYMTRYIAEHGFFSWPNWHIDTMWFPQGRDVAYMSFPGFAMTGAALYLVLTSLGLSVSVMDVTVIFPVVFAAITCIITYYLGKEVGGRAVGLLSALFLAISAAYISRTTLGFYKDETVGVFGIVLSSLFYLRSLSTKSKWQVSLAYAFGAGISLGFVFASSGISRYLLSLLVLFTFFVFVAKKYSRRLLISYGTLISVGLFMAVEVPKLGFKFIREFEPVAAIGVFLLLAVFELSRYFSEQRRRTFLVLSLAGLGGIVFILWQINFISLPLGKFIAVLNPFARTSSPILMSV
ncbi:MAG: STT3 domain-containing protein, partial [Candidatus Bathyarchaeota archaeon]